MPQITHEGGPLSPLLSTACLFDRLDDNSFCFFARQIGDGQVRDRLSPASLLFRIDKNLGDLDCYPWCAPINYRNVSFLFLGQGITPQTWFFYVIVIETSTRMTRFSVRLTLV